LRTIPFELQVVLELHYWEQCPVAEIAEVLGVPEGTAKSRLRRGREQLRAAVERLAERPDLAQSTLHGLDTWAREVQALARS
jgi:DNA-directed RNA polymerase specialized sigma24 family protein